MGEPAHANEIEKISNDSEKSKAVYAYVGQKIKERRRLLKMNQTQLAQLMGFSYQ